MNTKNLFSGIREVAGSAKDFLDDEFKISPTLERFNQKNDVFNRALWDEEIKAKNFFKSYDIANYKPKRSKGFDHWDYAFRNASWHLTDAVGERTFDDDGRVEGFTDYYSIQTGGSPNKVEIE